MSDRTAMQSYRPRIVDAELNELLADLPAVSIEGPKGVGKTETARQCQATSGIDPPATPKTDPPKKRRMLLKWWVFR